MAEPVKWAADLIRRLKETGTGDTGLNVIRAAMTAKFKREDVLHLHPKNPARHLTAAEAIDALVARELDAGRPADSVTVTKARQLVATGEYVVPVAATRARDVEDLLPPPPEAPDADLELDTELLDGEGEGDGADDLESLTVAELKALAADRNVHLPDGARKADIVAALRAAAAAE